jgi:hypothetical protein
VVDEIRIRSLDGHVEVRAWMGDMGALMLRARCGTRQIQYAIAGGPLRSCPDHVITQDVRCVLWNIGAAFEMGLPATPSR